MGIRVSVGASKNGQTVFHKLMYYGPVSASVDERGLLEIVETGPDFRSRLLAVVKDWVYFEYVAECEDNRKQYKEGSNEVEALA